MRKILVLGGSRVHCKVVEAAHEMGLYVLVTDFLEKENSPAKLLADKSFNIDIRDIELVVKMCQEEKVDAVVATHLDPCQIPYQKICGRLGLPCLGTAEQFQYLTNKHRFKEICRNYGIGTIPEYTEEELQCGKGIFPVFVKPVDSRGSRGQSRCLDQKQLAKAIDKAGRESTNGDYIVEAYLKDAEEIQVTYFVCNGKPYLIRTADSCRREGKFGNVVECGVSPSKYTLEYLESAHKRVEEMLKGMGIMNGPVMLQGFYVQKSFLFFDPGFRFPGVDYERIYKKEYGIDLLKLVIDFALRGKMKQIELDQKSIFLNGKKALTVFPLLSAGIIGKIEGLQEIEADPRVVSLLPRHKEGDAISWTYDLNHRLCEIDLLVKEGEIVSNLRWIYSTIKVYDVDGSNMLCMPGNY